MGVVNQHGIGHSRRGNHLYPALDTLGVCQGRSSSLKGNAQLQRNTQDGQGIVNRESAGDGQVDPGPFSFRNCREGNALGVEFHVFGMESGFCLDRGGQYRAGSRCQHPLGVRVVPVDHRPAAPAEELRLGIAVGIHGLVEIQMILRQIGKGRHIVVNAADPLQGDGMTGNLHHHMGTAGIPHLRKQGLKLKALRRGALGGDYLIADEVLHGADQSHLGPQAGFQHLLEQQCTGGFSVGAGDSDHFHGLRRMAEVIRADQSQGQPVGFHQHIAYLLLRLFGSDHHAGPLLHGHGDKSVAIGSKAGNGHKQGPGGHLSGIVADGGDLRFRVGGQLHHRNSRQQFSQFHSLSSFIRQKRKDYPFLNPGRWCRQTAA